jgi:hypothetical protein
MAVESSKIVCGWLVWSIHPNLCGGHTGGGFPLGEVFPRSLAPPSTKQKKMHESSTESELALLVAVDDCMPANFWTMCFSWHKAMNK